MAVIALTSLVTGIGFLLMGIFRLGRFIRFIPYPVIGGFLAGTGWLLVKGSFGVMANASLTLQLFQVGMLVKWLPGVLFAILLYIITRRYSHFLIIPALLIGAIVLFYMVMWTTGTSLQTAGAAGWLLGPFPQGALWRPFSLEDFQLVHWSSLLGSIGSIATILLVSAVSLLLNASGLELTVRQDIDLDHELRSSGLANILSALGGGTPGFQTLSLSTLGHRLKADSRLIGIFSAAVCGVVLAFGAPVLSLLPKPVIGALLFFLGLSFLVEWIYNSWFKLPHGEYAIILLILVAMNVFGVLQGVGLGILLATALFVVDYSRAGVVKHALSGASFRSNVDRPKLYEQLLRSRGESIHILELQGYIFFGTANALLEVVRSRVADVGLSSPRFVVLDFRQVSGLDASAVLAFSKMKQFAQTKGFILVFTGLKRAMQQRLETEVLTRPDESSWQTFVDLDQGMAWCEEQVIQQIESTGLVASFKTIFQQLAEVLPEPGGVDILASYLERMKIEAGDVLIHQGQLPTCMYFIEKGGADVQLQMAGGGIARLRKLGGGTIVGEIGMYSSQPATASVIADQPGEVFCLTADKLIEMESASPTIASALHHFIARLLSERLVDTTRAMEALLR